MQQPETSLEKSHSLTEDSWWHCLSLLPGADAFGELLCKDTPPTPQMLIVASLTCPSFFELKCPRSFVYLDSAITPSSLLPSSLAGTEVGRGTEPDFSAAKQCSGQMGLRVSATRCH